MKQIISLLTTIFILFLIFSCSKLNDDINNPEDFTHHPKGFGDPLSENFHGDVFVKNNWSFNLLKCQSCHGADYNGGTVGVTCLTCHTNPGGPEACNTCHGEFADPNFIAPPNDLDGNSDKGSKGVGAHYLHVYGNKVSTNIGCFECHKQTVSEVKFVHAHVGPPPAKMEFGSFSHRIDTLIAPIYDFNDLTCSDIYCHGGFAFKKDSSDNQWIYTEDQIKGNNYSPIWNSTSGEEAKCGTCHGKEINGELSPLPVGHLGEYMKKDCYLCHSVVVNNLGEIIDPLKHIDKMKDVDF